MVTGSSGVVGYGVFYPANWNYPAQARIPSGFQTNSGVIGGVPHCPAETRAVIAMGKGSFPPLSGAGRKYPGLPRPDGRPPAPRQGIPLCGAIKASNKWSEW